MTELSTLPADVALPPRRRSAGTWTLFSLSAVLGTLLALLGPGYGAQSYGAAVLAFTAALALTLAVVDERTGKLPNRLTGSLVLLGATQVLGISLRTQELAPLGVAAAVAGILGIIYGLLAVTGHCGFGDAKYAAAFALVLAPFAGFLSLYLLPLAFALSAIRSFVRLARGSGTRHPHGLSLTIAGLILLAGSLAAVPAFPIV